MRRAIITVYFPSASVRSNVEGISCQVDEVIICDNSPGNHSDLFAHMAAGNIRYVWFGENRGLSHAFNSVLKDPGFSWSDEDIILFFDQDSAVTEGHIDRMAEEFQRIRDAGCPVGCLGPVFYNTSSGIVERPKSRVPVTDSSYQVASLITSSMLTTYGNIRQAGFWNEEIFLDMADWDICWRMRAKGMVCCMTEVATLKHSLGKGEKKIGPFRLRVGSAFREYYQIRDCLYLLTKRYTPLKFRIRFLLMIFVRSPLHLLFLDEKKARAKYITMGLRDFFRGVRGQLIQKS